MDIEAFVRHVAPSTTEQNTTFAHLLNGAVRYLEVGEIYCEIGCQQGDDLIAALQSHPEVMGYAVESPERLDPEGQVIECLLTNLTVADLDERVLFCCQETEAFFADLADAGLTDKVGVYVYKGAPDYRSQLLALLLVKPFLAEQAVIIWATGGTTQATADFLAAEPQAKLLNPQPLNRDGVLVLSWTQQVFVGDNGSASLQDSVTIAAIADLARQEQAIHLDQLSTDAAHYLFEGKVEEAERAYYNLLLYDRTDANTWQNLGTLYHLTGKAEDALDALDVAIQLDTSNPLSHQLRGLTLQQMGRVQDAIAAHQHAIALKPDYTDAFSSLGALHLHQGELEQAKELFQQVIAIDPSSATAYANLGDVLSQQGDWAAAVQPYRQAVHLKLQDPSLWQKLIQAYQAIDDLARVNRYTVYYLYFEHRYEEAIAQFQAHFTLDQVTTYNECLILQDCYAQCGLTTKALECAHRVAQLCPDDAFLQIAPNLVLPFLYASSDEILTYRQRYLDAYNLLDRQVSHAKERGEQINFQILENFTNFFLPYQGYNDRSVLAIHGNLRHQLMVERYPAFTQPLPMPSIGNNGKIRIGYIAEALGNNSETRWALGWLKHHDRSQFEIYCYSINAEDDARTKQFRLLSDVFCPLPPDLDAVAKKIRSDDLHILVYVALGTRVKALSLASLRLAPVQCSAWGHPVTSGLPTIDYFLSGDLMEPDNAQEHYTETLIRLPNLGLCYPHPQFPPANKSRADLGLRDDAVVYLSCQLLFKYLPQYDSLFVEIAQRVPQAQIVFVLRSTFNNRSSPNLERTFQHRLRQVFADAGLAMEDYCVFLPGQDMAGYASLLTATDVFLDTLSFSGGHTTFDAIAHNLPIVCCPSEMMRGRQSAAALQMLGVTDTIASNAAEYVEIAVKLGLEPELRRAIADQMKVRHNYLFEDKTCVTGLEQFYRQVVHHKLQQSSDASTQVSRNPTTKTVLHVGCGPYNPDALPTGLRCSEWREVRLDIDPAVHPDVIGSITDLGAISDASVDAVFSSHNLEHLYAHQVPVALAEFYRVIKPGGFAVITLPDIQKVAEYVAQGKLEEPIYQVPTGTVAAIDILYGWRVAIAEGNEFMAHRTAFTDQTLEQKLWDAGFQRVTVEKDPLNLWAIAYK